MFLAELSEVKAVGPAALPGFDVAVDVGANIGACTIPLGLLGYRVLNVEIDVSFICTGNLLLTTVRSYYHYVSLQDCV